METKLTFYLLLLLSGTMACYLEHVKIRGKSMESLNRIFNKIRFDYENSYHNWTEIEKQLERVSKEQPNVTELMSIGKTVEDRDIWAVIISERRIDYKIVVIECGIHAREWISVSFCLWSIDKLLSDKSLLKVYQFVIIPVLNPDGYVYSWEMDRLWRKNREQISNNKDECKGVDINRNFNVNDFCQYKSDVEPCGEVYCGPTPHSSAEAKALIRYLKPKRHQLFAYFSMHSYSQLWCYHMVKGSTSDEQYLEKLSEIGVRAIRNVYGTEYKYGRFDKASGTSADYINQALGVKLVFTIEMRDQGQYGFILPCYMIKPICTETWEGVASVLDYLASGSTSYNQNHKIISIIIVILSVIFSG